MKNLLSHLWPPYELYLANRANNLDASFEDRWSRALDEMKVDLSSQSEEDAEKLASSVLEAEIKRKDVLESKAAAFVVTPTVATGITAVIAPLTNGLDLSSCTATIVTISYIVALIHLCVSSWYAIEARRTAAFVVLSSTNARDLMSMTRIERIAARLAYARLNEPALLLKSNTLGVSENLSLRGIAFLAFGSSLTLMAHVAGV